MRTLIKGPPCGKSYPGVRENVPCHLSPVNVTVTKIQYKDTRYLARQSPAVVPWTDPKQMPLKRTHPINRTRNQGISRPPLDPSKLKRRPWKLMHDDAWHLHIIGKTWKTIGKAWHFLTLGLFTVAIFGPFSAHFRLHFWIIFIVWQKNDIKWNQKWS